MEKYSNSADSAPFREGGRKKGWRISTKTNMRSAYMRERNDKNIIMVHPRTEILNYKATANNVRT
jgi:hypothetical protein